MGILKSFFENVRKPGGLGGQFMLSMMNAGHNKNALWGLAQLEIPPKATVLDVGCGGGRNISNLLLKAAEGKVYGVDYSPASVEKSKKVNQAAIAQGRAEVLQASVSALPFNDGKFDVVTAFETIYFWPVLSHDFREVRRVLKAGGVFLICNEASKPEDFETWTKMLDMPVYTKEELSNALVEAGFGHVSCQLHENGKWLCVTAQNR